jgi:hypothetical protein
MIFFLLSSSRIMALENFALKQSGNKESVKELNADNPNVVLFIPGAGSSGTSMGGLGVGVILSWIKQNEFFRHFSEGLKKQQIKSFICPKSKDGDTRTLIDRKEECIKQILESPYCEKSFTHSKRTIVVFGHSMGGLIARMLASDERVSSCIYSVTTLSTPHKGTAIADFIIRSFKEGSWVNIYNWILRGLDFHPKNKKYLKELIMNRKNISSDSDQFHAQDLEMNKYIKYYSFSTSFRDTLLFPLYKTQRIIDEEMKRIFNDNVDTLNDGIVPESSQIFGKYLGHIESTHFEAICPDMLIHSVGCKAAKPIVLKHITNLFNKSE